MKVSGTKKNTNKKKRFRRLMMFVVVAAAAAGGTLAFAFDLPARAEGGDTEASTNKYASFTTDVYDIIKDKYWEELSDKKLATAYKKGVERIQKRNATIASKDKEGVAKLIESAVSHYADAKKKQLFTEQLNHMVLMSLRPEGRSKLMSREEENKMRERVKNVDKGSELYKNLGLEEGATGEEVSSAYERKSSELSDKMAEAKEAGDEKKLKELEKRKEAVEYSKEVLTDKQSKKKYDEEKVVPTVFAEEVNDEIVYMKIGKMSPQTLEEFVSEANEVKGGDHHSLILDLRGNVGGAVDILPYFLGPFIGPNQKAYEFFSQGEHTPYKTKTGWLESLVKYKKVVVLIDRQSQSTAETFASALKTYNVGILVGTPTRGWGTIENTFPVEARLSENKEHFVFLVHSLTVRPDGQPIEGRGIDPHVYVTEDNWEDKLRAYYSYEPLITEVSELIAEGTATSNPDKGHALTK